jgi:hypothetical protein
LGAGGARNAGAAPSDGGVPGSSLSGGGEAGGAAAPNDGIGNGAGDVGYGSANGARPKSAAGVVSIGRGISGVRNGDGAGGASDGMLEPPAGEIR